MQKLIKVLKEIFDVLAHVHTITELGKLVPDGVKKRMEDRLFRDVRGEVLKDIHDLDEENRQNWPRRLQEAQAKGKEDQYMWDLGTKVPKEYRRDILEWLDILPDEEFEAMMNILHDDKLVQFYQRAKRFIMSEGGATARATGKFVERATVRAARPVRNLAQWLESRPGGTR